MKKQFQRLWGMVTIIAKRFMSDRLTYSASALTFTTLLALVPLVAVCMSILSAFPVFHSLKDGISQFIFSNFIPTSGEVIQNYLEDFVSQAGKLSLFGTILLVGTAIMMMLTIEHAFNNIWKIRRRRQGLQAFLRYWAVLSLAPIFMAISIAATTYLISLPVVRGTAIEFGAHKILLASVPIILTIFAFTLIYIAVPNCRVPFRHAFISAVIATILFQLAKRWFVIYVLKIPTYHHIYGAMAAIPIFLVWLYLIWVIILFGALISNVLATDYFHKRGGRIDGFTHAFLWLGYLWKAQNAGGSLSINQLFRALPGHYEIEPNLQLQWLKEMSLIETTNKNSFVLARDFSKITLADLYNMLPWKLSKVQDKNLHSKQVHQVLIKAHESLDKTMDVSLENLYEDLFDVK